MMARCSLCGKDLDPSDPSEWIISISGSIMGDECTETFYYCSGCEVYTKEIIWDRFSGSESISVQGPIEKADGDEMVALIKGCKEPWNKKCRCPSHMKYFWESLD